MSYRAVSVKEPHWYKIVYAICPICGRYAELYRNRMPGERPVKDDNAILERAQYCDIHSGAASPLMIMRNTMSNAYTYANINSTVTPNVKTITKWRDP